MSNKPTRRATPALPHALRDLAAFDAALGRRRLHIFLDYDGTLTPIVPRPDDAVLHPCMQAALRKLAARYPTAVVSGRKLDDVRQRVGLPELYYSGNHGFEIAGPAGAGVDWQFGREYVDELDALHGKLAAGLPPVDGLILEHKGYSLSVHYRLVAEQAVSPLERALTEALAEHPGLRLRHGKQVFEVRPAVDWHKGKAVRRLMDLLDEDALAIFIGDDFTDEDAFEELRGTGLGVLVSESPRTTAAAFRVDDTEEVRQLLEHLADR